MKNGTNIDWNKATKIFAPEKENVIAQLKGKLNEHPKTKIILILLAGGVGLSLATISPAAPLALSSFVKLWKSFDQRRLKQTLWRFKKQKFIDLKEKNGQQVVSITTKGLTRALSYKLEEMKIKEPKKWDEKWRMAIFDIADKKKRHREIFREKIKSLGLYLWQKSVYVYPFPCFDELEFLRQVFGVGIEVKYVVAEKIEDDENLRNHFCV